MHLNIFRFKNFCFHFRRTKTPEENNGKAVTKRDDEIETDIPKFFVEKRTRKISRRPSEEIEEGEYR
jgi:hypothetical protein